MAFWSFTKEDLYLEKAIRGEKDGLEYLVNHYKDLAYTVAFRIVRNREDAEEILQDSFMKAFASLPKFRKEAKFSTWFFRIVYNTALTKVRSKATPLESIDGAENAKYASIEGHGNASLRSDERKKYIEMAMQDLSDEEYLLISLYYLTERTIPEISVILGLKNSAVKMRLFLL